MYYSIKYHLFSRYGGIFRCNEDMENVDMSDTKPVVEIEVRVDGVEVASAGFFPTEGGEVVSVITAINDPDIKPEVIEALRMATEAFRYSHYGSTEPIPSDGKSFFHG